MIAVQTELSKDMGNSDLFVDGGFSENNQLFVARILTKVLPHNNKITVQVTNLVDHFVFLTKGTEIAEVTPFVEKQVPKFDDAHAAAVLVDENMCNEILSEDDLDIEHLQQDQKDRLLDLLRRLQIKKHPHLGQVDIVKHNINGGDAQPIKQQPNRLLCVCVCVCLCVCHLLLYRFLKSSLQYISIHTCKLI